MKKILIVGGGGIGERHVRCFLATGKVEASVCETRRAKVRQLAQTYPLAATYADFDDVPLDQFDGVVIGVPAHLHVPMATACAEAGVPFLLEKPLSVSLRGVERLKTLVRSKRLVAGVGYTRRSVPSFVKFRQLCLGGMIGKPKMGRFTASEDFARARPDYRRISYAFEKQGGGCILDASSHFVNLAEWIFGQATEVVSLYDRLQLKGVECEDCCMMLLRFRKSRALAEVFLNQFQKPTTIDAEVIGTKGNLRYERTGWTYGGQKHRIRHCDNPEGKWKTVVEFSYKRDDTFIHQAKDFLAAIDGRGKMPTSIAEAETTLRICLAARQSQKQKKILSLNHAK